MLFGRSLEIRQIGAVLDAARSGSSGALVVVADPGGGKSALLEHAAETAGGGWQVLRANGIESESELPFAGLYLLLGPALDRVDTLPTPQRDALRGAFGLGAVDQDDRFLVGLATLSLLAELSTDAPVLCLIDDAQWLDRPSADALVFAARRLGAESIAVLFAARPEFSTAGLRELRPGPLDPDDARALLTARMPELAPEVRDRVLAEAAGNPLAVLELPRMLAKAAPAGPIPLPERLRTGYQAHIANQTPSARLALVVVAAEETGNLHRVLRAMTKLGLHAGVLAEAEASCMVTVSFQSVTFRHPLKRAAAYQLASFTQRAVVHAAIAEVLRDDPDRRAWHLAAAATGPDEPAAAALEAVAERARERTGFATAATAFERAAKLTPDPSERMRRMVCAVETAAEAGRAERARRLAAEAALWSPDPLARGRIGSALGLIAFEHGALGKAYQRLIVAARDTAAADPQRAGAIYIEAARMAWTGADLVGVVAARDELAVLPLGEHRDTLVHAVEGPLALHSDDPAAGVAMIRENVANGRSWPVDFPMLRFTFAVQAGLIGDSVSARELLSDLADEFRCHGRVGWLPAVTAALGAAEVLLGHFREAAVVSEECLRIATDVGQPNRIAGAEANLALVAAVRGDEVRCRELAERNLRHTGDVNSIETAYFEWALALLDLGYGRCELALDRLELLYHSPNRALGQWIQLLADRVEAAVRLRRPDRAEEAMAAIERWAAAIAAPWADAFVLRCQAMLHGDGELFADAAKIQAAEGLWYDCARTELLYGEALRRERRNADARTRLRKAMEIFDRLGATPWAERARAELRAAGEGTVPEPETDVAAVLTPQEFQVVRLAAAGATNKEIGAKLFLSPKTVGHHLYRAFPKLGVTSRVELARLDLD
ncbi:AAA family ATPase [Nocardia sp. NPDC052566]|uniref:helix-turn-helix transcriptional regulator n=1 Tax=Nocardia sp. NPDC052566 TaxID=3364330 RepID=UPI0037C66B5C